MTLKTYYFMNTEQTSKNIFMYILFLAQTADKDDSQSESIPFENILYRMYTVFFLSDLQQSKADLT